jgi:hypothetical protein
MWLRLLFFRICVGLRCCVISCQWRLDKLVAGELPRDVRYRHSSPQLHQSRPEWWRQLVQWTYFAILQHAALPWYM